MKLVLDCLYYNYIWIYGLLAECIIHCRNKMSKTFVGPGKGWAPMTTPGHSWAPAGIGIRWQALQWHHQALLHSGHWAPLPGTVRHQWAAYCTRKSCRAEGTRHWVQPGIGHLALPGILTEHQISFQQVLTSQNEYAHQIPCFYVKGFGLSVHQSSMLSIRTKTRCTTFYPVIVKFLEVGS